MQHDSRFFKQKMDFQSKVNCIPNSLTLQMEKPEVSRKRARSSNAVCRDARMASQDNGLGRDQAHLESTPLQTFDAGSNQMMAYKRKKSNNQRRNNLFKSNFKLAEPESEAATLKETPMKQVPNSRMPDAGKLSGLVSPQFVSQLDLNYNSRKVGRSLSKSQKKLNYDSKFKEISTSKKMCERSIEFRQRSQFGFAHDQTVPHDEGANLHREGRDKSCKKGRGAHMRNHFESQFTIE